ncbi:uncharacterized protein LOC110412610 isoform X2 [Herrania umbratica]|uniref:Uncharacterized protein LOC110412610 isoform X2 n=1 Tax=Herrania umbratica TaxID=108875 RepID=A0A6J0ZVX2_9ROSI|nr:uncharacterized protein LOC110412610 isoform X2 [Herrania umbratica]
MRLGKETVNSVQLRKTLFRMELSVHSLTFASYAKNSWPKVRSVLDYRVCSLVDAKSKENRRKLAILSSALPETAASVAIAATVVGAAATFLVRRTKSSDATEVPLRPCEDCEGSGICSECKGEGFVLKKMSEDSAEKARMTAKNMATRYTAGLPKKWSYCTRCSSSRSCSTCGGSGKLSY